MQPDRDIYSAPEDDERRGQGLPVVDVVPANLRARTRRTAVGFAVVMVVFLLAAWFVGYLLEQQDEGVDRAPLNAGAPEPGTVAPPSGLMLATPQVAELTESYLRSRDEVEPELDRTRIAEAMDEVRLAAQYVQTREWDGAEIHARRALETWPDMNVALRLVGYVYTQRGQFDQAIAILEHALAGNPFNPETFNNLATAYMQKLELEHAEGLLRTALDVRPDFTPALVNLGLLYVIMGRYEDTIDYLERALEFVPENVSARNNLGVALLRVNRYEEARKHLEYLIAEYPGRAPAYFNVAITHVYERNVPEAMRYIQAGARQCSPMECLNYLNDGDFDALRNHPAFQQFIRELYPDLPQLPGE